MLSKNIFTITGLYLLPYTLYLTYFKDLFVPYIGYTIILLTLDDNLTMLNFTSGY